VSQTELLAVLADTGLPDPLDMAERNHLLLVKNAATKLLKMASFDQLIEMESSLASKAEISLSHHLAVKLAKSRKAIEGLSGPVHVSVVFAAYKEHTRIVTRDDHEHGEDFLVRKAQQLDWLADSTPHLTWDLTLVDDGCPEGTGKIAQQIIEDKELGERVKVLFLEDAIAAKAPMAVGLNSTADSQKGGAVLHGMWTAAQESHKGTHVVIFTDADLSTHLGQVGLLLDPILTGRAQVAIGSRREPTSSVIKVGTRNNRGKLFIYLWKRLLPELKGIIDTQCGFKAFRADTLEKILDGVSERKFAFDIELLIKAAKAGYSTERVPLAWIDSDAASTTADIQPYLPMLNSVVGYFRRYEEPNPTSEAFANLIERIDQTTWNRMVDNVPASIVDHEPVELEDWAGVSAEDLAKI